MAELSRIQTLSSRLYRIFFILLFLVPVLTAGYWLLFNHLPRDMVSLSLPPGIGLPDDLGLPQRFLGLAVSMITLVLEMYALVTLMRLFRLYQAGQIFSQANVTCFRRLGKCLAWYTLARIVQVTLIGLVLTLNNPPGQRMLTVSLSSRDFTLLVVALMVLVISWVMDEGRKLTEEQALTI